MNRFFVERPHAAITALSRDLNAYTILFEKEKLILLHWGKSLASFQQLNNPATFSFHSGQMCDMSNNYHGLIVLHTQSASLAGLPFHVGLQMCNILYGFRLCIDALINAL